jgi:site-specific recombinase XerC
VTAAAATVQAFFTERPARQRCASPHTIAAYRDTLRLLLCFAAERAATVPCRIGSADLTAPQLTASARPLRAAAGQQHPHPQRPPGRHLLPVRLRGAAPPRARRRHRTGAGHPAQTRRPDHRHPPDRQRGRHAAGRPDRSTRTGRRDHAWILLAIQTGLRASELTGLTCGDVHLGHGAYVACPGQGRKDPTTPLTPGTVTTPRAWPTERGGQPGDPLFVTSRGGPLSHHALQQRLAVRAAKAVSTCPTLAAKKITPHVLRHTAAMRLPHAGTDITVIALWPGHESVTTTQIYLQADMALKQQALDRTTPPATPPGRNRPSDQLLAFLEAL